MYLAKVYVNFRLQLYLADLPVGFLTPEHAIGDTGHLPLCKVSMRMVHVQFSFGTHPAKE